MVVEVVVDVVVDAIDGCNNTSGIVEPSHVQLGTFHNVLHVL